MKNSVVKIAAASLLTAAFVSQASAETKIDPEAGPILFNESVPTVEAKIDETPMAAPAKAPSLPVKAMDVEGAMPAAEIKESGSTKVTAVELESDGALQVGTTDIDVRTGTLDDVEQGEIVMMEPASTTTVAPKLNDEIKVGELYYGQDGNVYRFVGNKVN